MRESHFQDFIYFFLGFFLKIPRTNRLFYFTVSPPFFLLVKVDPRTPLITFPLALPMCSYLLQLLALFVFCASSCDVVVRANGEKNRIVIFGSVNADTFLPVQRLPVEGENVGLLPGKLPECNIPGGKGATQAVAASKLSKMILTTDDTQPSKRARDDVSVSFVGRFGGIDSAVSDILESALADAQVDISQCKRHESSPCGHGYVFTTQSGKVSAVVSGGANLYGWDNLREDEVAKSLERAKCVLLQAEIPSSVNEMVARVAKRKGVTVIQDVGGEDRILSESHMRNCDYIIPNETELVRLVNHYENLSIDTTNESSIVQAANILQKNGAKNVLVTMGSHGSILVPENGNAIRVESFSAAQVVDETGAGDCFRAAFAVALTEGKTVRECLEFASAAGCCSVEKRGAIPSTPSREEVQRRIDELHRIEDKVIHFPRGDGQEELRAGGESFPFLIGSRLNSMKDRPELWTDPLQDTRDLVRRQASIDGLTCVDFNFPQHFHSWSVHDARAELESLGLVAGAVCLRFPSKFARGAMHHPDPELRREAIQMTMEAADAAIVLGCSEVVVWSAFDGYDYPFQQDYDTAWLQLVEAFQACCDKYPRIRFSVEYKPTDENTRFFTIPSTGAAVLFMKEVNRDNFGLTLDVGHMLMAGENPGQSIAMVGRSGKLFGIQLNDGFTRLAAEDGLMFGSVHPSVALEIMYQLRKIKFDGHLYFDTFPQRTDPVKEAAYNIKRVKAFWHAAGQIDARELSRTTSELDAIGALDIAGKALRMFHVR